MKIVILACLFVAALVFAGCTTEQAPQGEGPAEPEPIGTLEDSWTPEPTWTPQPTWTPVPTWTPEPTQRPTATPIPQPTAMLNPTSTPYPTLTPEEEERLIATLYECFQIPEFSQIVAEEIGISKELIAPLLENWESFRAIMLLGIQEDPSIVAEFLETEALISAMCASRGTDSSQVQSLQVSGDLREYADPYAGGPGAIYIGDIHQLVGPAPAYDLGDGDGDVPLYALEQHEWIYESDYYQRLLARARLTNPTELVSSDERIALQHICINRLLLWCKHLETYFAPNVEARTKGQVTVNISSFPELGLAGTDTATLLADGTLSMTEIYGGYVGGEFPTLTVQYLWGLWPDHQTHYEAQTNIVPDLDRVITEDLGAQVLMRNWIAGDDQFLFSNKKLENPEDFVGLKTRSHSAELSDWINGMGAAAQFMAFAEVYTALERGILDAGVTGANPGLSQRWYEVVNYMNGPLYSFNSTINAINRDVWDSIPWDLQQILIEEGAKHELEALRLAAIQNLTGIQRNIDAGLELVEFGPELRKLSFQAAHENVVPNWLQRLGYPGEGQEVVYVFNNKIGPIVGLRINSDGSVTQTRITEGPHAGKTMEQVLSE